MQQWLASVTAGGISSSAAITDISGSALLLASAGVFEVHIYTLLVWCFARFSGIPVWPTCTGHSGTPGECKWPEHELPYVFKYCSGSEDSVACALQGFWQLPFAPDDTRPARFTLANGSAASVAMMHRSAADVELLALPNCFNAALLPFKVLDPTAVLSCCRRLGSKPEDYKSTANVTLA